MTGREGFTYRKAALLQLELLEAAIPEGMTLKDTTPYNIQFVSVRPVFIDIPSFETLPSGVLWSGYRQFCEMFLFPLMLQAYKGIDFQPFMRAGINGVGIQNAARLFGLRHRERTDLHHRARPDLFVCLALIHHVVISANIPLDEFVEWLAESSDQLIIEYVSRKDGKVQSLLRNKGDIYSDHSRKGLEKALDCHYGIFKKQSLNSGNRFLYWCRRSPA